MEETHLVPKGTDDRHTTRDCWCRPLLADVRYGLLGLRAERLVFHRDVPKSQEGRE